MISLKTIVACKVPTISGYPNNGFKFIVTIAVCLCVSFTSYSQTNISPLRLTLLCVHYFRARE